LAEMEILECRAESENLEVESAGASELNKTVENAINFEMDFLCSELEASRDDVAIEAQCASQWQADFSLLKVQCAKGVFQLQENLDMWIETIGGECDLDSEKAEAASEKAEVASVDTSIGSSVGEASKSAQTGGGKVLKQDMGEFGIRITELKNSACNGAKRHRFKAAAIGATGGGLVLGTGGAASGLVTGSIVGAAFGVLAAPFTFGFSVLAGAVVGSGTGLCVGTAVGGTSGVVGGGATGYGAAVVVEKYREH